MTVSSAICPFCGPTRARVRWTFSNLLRAAANACLVPFWPHFNIAAGALLAGFTVCWGLPLSAGVLVVWLDQKFGGPKFPPLVEPG